MSSIRTLCVMVFAVASSAVPSHAQQPTPRGTASPPSTGPLPYRLTHRYVLGGPGRWDYLAFDTAGHRLFIARQDRVMVVNPDNGAVLGEIPGLNGAHGIAFDDALGHGFISSGRDSSVTMFDTKTLRVLSRTTAADDDDAILYDPASKHIITFNGDAQSATVIDPATNTRIGTIALGAKPEYGVADGNGMLYVNLTDVGEIAEINAHTLRVTRRWSVAPCAHATGMAIDRATHRLFSGCRNKCMAISDAIAGRLITTVPIGEGVDANVFDASTANIFSSNGDGTLTVVHADGRDHYHVVAAIPTMRSARTMTMDPHTHILYTVTAELRSDPGGNPKARTVQPNTFTLLVLEPSRQP